MYEAIDPTSHTANLSVAVVDIQSGQITDQLYTYPEGFFFTFATFDDADRVMFANAESTSSPLAVSTIAYDTGKTVRAVNVTFPPIRPVYYAPGNILIDSGFYCVPTVAYGLVASDPKTGAYASLNITLVGNTNNMEIGPCGVDPVSNTYFIYLVPGGPPNPAFFYQVDLDKKVVTRSFGVDSNFYDGIWQPASS